jgi:hypothetical protein
MSGETTMGRETPQSGPHFQVRFDKSHNRGPDVEITSNDASGPTESSDHRGLAAATLSRVRNHASQLASHLRSLSDDLDRREAELNSREAGAESDMRGLRLSFESQQHQLRERSERLDAQEQSLRKALKQLLMLVDNDVASTHRDLKPIDNTESLERQLDRATTALLRQQKERQAKETVLAQNGKQAKTATDQLCADCVQKQGDSQHQWIERETALQRRAAAIDSRQTDLDASHIKIMNASQETLDLLLATERLCCQLSQRSPEPETVHQLEKIGHQLITRYEGAQEDLLRQKAQLEEAEERLKQRYIDVTDQRQHLEKDLADQLLTIEQREAMLAVQEQQLEQQQREQAMQAELWKQERWMFQQQILELTSGQRQTSSQMGCTTTSDDKEP